VLLQAGTIRDNRLFLNHMSDILDIILVVLLSVASSWHFSASSDFCMNFLPPRKQSRRDAWQTGRNSVIAAAMCASHSSSTGSTLVPTLLFI